MRKLVPLVAAAQLVSAWAGGMELYRIEVVGGGVVFAQNQPEISGGCLVFLSSPQGSLVSLKRYEVIRIEPIETVNKPPPDYGRAQLHQPLVGIRRAAPLEAPSSRSEWDSGWKPPRSKWASMKTGREPGKTIAFPVSADDLKPGNYEPFPVGVGGESGPPPAYREGQIVPRAGSLQEPPGVIHLGEMPGRANERVLSQPLVFSQRPAVEPPPLPVTGSSSVPTPKNPDVLPQLP